MKLSARIFPLTAALLLAACGDEVTQINQTGLEVYSAVKDLSKCGGDNEGDQAFVKEDNSTHVCVDGEWVASAPSGSEVNVSCSTEELKDKSGLKIVCNGDSIGVVYNGAQGEAGAGCNVAEKADSLVTIVCGDKSITMNLGAGSISVGTFVPDSEKVAISLDSLAGYSQKGPFLKGSTVYLYELSDGRTLKQTNGNFTSLITRDDGHYKFTARDLASQYAMIVVEGYYRNEVTGEASNAPIRLRALTDMRKRSNANVNLLTHLEFDRVYYLVTREGKTVKQAKKQAQKEIFSLFHIDMDGLSGASEDLDVFGETDADAALLAISVLLQGDNNESNLSVLLTEIANAIETGGEWTGSEAESAKAKIADWAQAADVIGTLSSIREKVKGWGLSDTVPDFEKYVKNYWYQELGFGTCGSDTVPEFTLKGSLVNYDYNRAFMRMYLCRSGEWENLSPWSWDVPKESRMNPNIAYGEMTDSRDNQTYRTAQIGNQTWMAENLNYADTARTPSLKGHMWCYGDKEENCAVAGRLYTWDAAIDGICPEGWHLPDTTDWRELLLKVGGDDRGGELLKSLSGWGETEYGNTRNGTDDYGFSALPVGARYINDTFGNQGKFAYFWSATEHDATHAYHVYIYVDITRVSLVYDNSGASVDNTKENGFSVRCIKDK